jgi:phage/plasmid-like protein (TIGR03299 family)
MSHAFESGFVVREQAWHGLATVLEDNPTIEEALAAAGLDWEVEAIPLTGHMPQPADAGVNAAGEIEVPTLDIEIPTHRAVIRKSDRALLGVVSKDYKVFQNAEALAVFTDLVKDGTLSIETAGSLQGGRKVWILCRYAPDIEVRDGDVITPYILIAMGHDGKLSIVFMNTPTRVVCWNTMQAAGAVEDSVAFDQPTTFRIAHMGDVQGKVEAARDSIVAMNRDLKLSVDAYREMAKKPIGEVQVRAIAQSIFDTDMVKAKHLLEKLRNVQAVRGEHQDIVQRQVVADKIAEVEKLLVDWKPSRAENEVVKAFHEAPGADLAGETVWGMVNAVTNYIDHGKQGSQDRRMSASWFGNGARQRTQAFVMAQDLIS